MKYKPGDKVRQTLSGWNIPEGEVVTIVEYKYASSEFAVEKYHVCSIQNPKKYSSIASNSYGFCLDGPVVSDIDKEYEELLI